MLFHLLKLSVDYEINTFLSGLWVDFTRKTQEAFKITKFPRLSIFLVPRWPEFNYQHIVLVFAMFVVIIISTSRGHFACYFFLAIMALVGILIVLSSTKMKEGKQLH